MSVSLLSSLPLVAGGELRFFCDLVCEEDFYGFLAEDTGLPRDDVKHRFLVDVLAKRDSYPCRGVEATFKAKFPSIHRFVREINRHDRSTLIRELQRLEAWLVIEGVSPRLVGRIPFVTLHDAIFCRQGDVGVVEDAFNETFEEIDFRLQFKSESWGPAATA